MSSATKKPAPPADSLEALVERRSGPGIMVFSTTFQLLHVDPRAQELCRRIVQSQHGTPARGVVPPIVMDFCLEVRQAIQARSAANDYEQFQLRKLTGTVQRPILLRGYGLPESSGIDRSRIMIMMEEVGRGEAVASSHVKARFQLTDREQGVVQHLAKGFTNKEIAVALNITEQTVKEHIKNIMTKTKANTRTGVLAQVLCA
jgi:DNA-binding CsgD family transcriptional regulator